MKLARIAAPFGLSALLFCPGISVQQRQRQWLFPSNANGNRDSTGHCWHCSYFLE